MSEQGVKKGSTLDQTTVTADPGGNGDDRKKKPYRPPALIVLGTLANMTQAHGTSGHTDGARKPYSRTH